MSVLIKGMKMPTSCDECRLSVDGGCVPQNQWLNEEGTNKRLDNCPLIELPSPHGDLIDRDALIKSLDKLCDRVCQYSKAQRKVMCSACPLGHAFTVIEDDAPTIIPAEV